MSAVPAPLPSLVLDSNIVLDLWVFEDPAVQPLREALAAGATWWATAAMREELARVLTYPHLASRLQAGGQTAEAVLAQWDAAATLCPTPPKARCTCTDADDQAFIDLAVERAASPAAFAAPVLLLSKDKAVLRLRKRLATLGVTVRPTWPSSL